MRHDDFVAIAAPASEKVSRLGKVGTGEDHIRKNFPKVF